MSVLHEAGVQSAPPEPPVSPGVIWSIIQGHTRYWAVAAAVRLGVFDLVMAGQRSVADLARDGHAEPAQLQVLLDALVTIGMLAREGDEYTLTAESEAFLVRSSARFMGDLVLHSPGRHENWLTLADTVRRGRPPSPIDEDQEFWRDIAGATWSVQHELARRTVIAMGLAGSEKPLRILDVGAGAAPWAIALLQALPNATALVNDLPDVLTVARSQVERTGLVGRVTFVAGDHRTVSLADGGFDVVVLANVVRTEGERLAPVMLRRAGGWLAPAGAVLLADYFVDDERRAATTALLLGLTMMANTRHGATFTVSQYRGWLTAAGLADVELLELGGAQVIVARHGPTGGRGLEENGRG